MLLKDKLKEKLLERKLDIKEYALDRCINKYLTEVINELRNQFAAKPHELIDIAFEKNKVLHNCGRINVNDKKEYIFSIMQAHISTSLILVQYEGNTIRNKVSIVMLNPIYKNLIMQELNSDQIENITNSEYLDELDAKSNQDIPIDLRSLQSYIRITQQTIDGAGKSSAYNNKLITNLNIAKKLVNRHRTALIDGVKVDYMAEYWEEIDCGRLYGHGLSLQRVPKIVRHAALGPCTKYDFNAASYALIGSTALSIDPTIEIGCVRDYVINREEYRKHIAYDVGLSEKQVKEIFTAVGFGAKTNDNPHSYIRGTFGDEIYKKLMKQSEFEIINRQFELACDVVLSAAQGSDFYIKERKYVSKDPHTGRERNRNQKLAWIYQSLERYVLDFVINKVDATPLLTTHDCIYYKEQLSSDKKRDIEYLIRQEFPLFLFDGDDVSVTYLKTEEEELETERHKKFIRHEEWVANHIDDYMPILSDISVPIDYSKETKQEYEDRHKKEFDESIVEYMNQHPELEINEDDED